MGKRHLLLGAALLSIGVTPALLLAADAPAKPMQIWRNAPQLNQAEKAPIIAATNAGRRVVAVGDYGIIILSDDGKHFRQAKLVPTRAVLTSVYFIDDQRGWVVGHDGTVLTSGDGGETWQLLREEPGKERVLLSLWFENAQHGMVVGQFGLTLETEDGGKTWKERRLVDGEVGEKHFMSLFAGKDGLLLVAAESGTMLRSEDSGRNWKAVQTDNRGSFWTGMVLADGAVVAAGMRGHVYRSEDRGLSWKEIPTGTQQSITAISQKADASLRLIGNAGTNLTSRDSGRSFVAANRSDRANLTALAVGAAGDLLFTLSGVVEEGK